MGAQGPWCMLDGGRPFRLGLLWLIGVRIGWREATLPSASASNEEGHRECLTDSRDSWDGHASATDPVHADHACDAVSSSTRSGRVVRRIYRVHGDQKRLPLELVVLVLRGRKVDTSTVSSPARTRREWTKDVADEP